MSKGSALVSILFAFLSGIVMGYIVSGSSSGGSGEEVVADAKGDGEKAGAAQAPSDDGVQRFKVPVTAAQPVKGPADAPSRSWKSATSSARSAAASSRRSRSCSKDYKDKVRVVWRNNPLPFHPNACPPPSWRSKRSHRAAATSSGRRTTSCLRTSRRCSRDNLDSYAQELGLDIDQVQGRDGQPHAQVQDRRRPGDGRPKSMHAARPRSSSTVASCRGAQPVDKFKEIIDDELKRADKLDARAASPRRTSTAR